MSDFETVPVGPMAELERLREENAALAAHVERLHALANLANLMGAEDVCEELVGIDDDRPEISLARRDARMRADAMHEAICDLESEFDPCHPLIERLEAKEAEYRRQAEDETTHHG